MKTKLFLSNAEIVDQQFLDFCSANQLELHAKSLIAFKAVEYNPDFSADVIFFASPRSVDFFRNSITNENTALACLGTGTEKRLNALGYQADFVGSNSGQPEIVSGEFLSWLGERTVLFPLSSKSNRSISQNIPAPQLKEVIVYETLTVPQNIEPADCYVFTSPSNVEAFFELNVLPENARIIAWGKTTEKKLFERGISPKIVLENSSLRSLERVLVK